MFDLFGRGSSTPASKTWLTIDQVFNDAEAGSHLRLFVGPGGALDLELGKEVGLLRLCLPLSHIEGPRLLRELSDQPVTLLGQFAALRLFAAQGCIGFA